MDVILLERVERLGQMGDVVSVKPGFARNFLLPKGKALRATDDNLKRFETERAQLEAENLKRRDEADSVAQKMDSLAVVIVRQASDSDQLYGSVTTRDIAAEVTAAGFSIDKNQVQLDTPIKTVGLHNVRVTLHPEISVDVVANVARSEEEADLQARGESVNPDDDDLDDTIDAEASAELFEEGQAPDAEELSVDAADEDAPAAEGATAEEGDAAAAEEEEEDKTA